MWLKIDLSTFEVSSGGGWRTRVRGPRTLYASPEVAHIEGIGELADCEYGQAVDVDRENRTVDFGRDYLGHFPLLYACTKTALIVGDEMAALVRALRAEGAKPTISEEAVALYFAMGYVPAGMSIYNEVVACEGHATYRWQRGRVEMTSTFRPVEIDPDCGLPDLDKAISREVERWGSASKEIDVWCSGGIDSSIMATAFNSGGRRSELLT